jgi:hypothetical protein
MRERAPSRVPLPHRPPRLAPMAKRRNRRVKQGPSVALRAARAVWATVPYVIGVGMLCIVVIGTYVGWQELVKQPSLQVHAIEVRGLSRTRREEVIAYAGLKLGQPILALDLDAVAIKIRSHPWIQSATLRRQLPDRLSIEVVEHEPTLVVSLGELYVADTDGQLFKSFCAADGLVLPVLTGIDRDEATHHMDRVTEHIRGALALASGLENHRSDLGDLEELHWDDDLGWSVVLALGQYRGASVRVHLGHEPLSRVSATMATLRILDERHQVPSVIWADGLKNPDRVQVQLASGAGAWMPVVAAPRPKTQTGQGNAAGGRGREAPLG